MTKQKHHWRPSLARGEAWEKVLDDYFSKWFRIQPATWRQQASGIDRIFRDKKRTLKIEYKTDEIAATSGNAFIETKAVSSRAHYKPGWAKRCAADYILYYIPAHGTIYMLNPSALRARVSYWARIYEIVQVDNPTYHAEGILVPLEVLEEVAHKVIDGPIPK